MVAPVILPVVFTALSTSVATGVGYLSLKWGELNGQVQTLVEQQRLKAVETTREAAGDLLAPLKQWLRPIGGWAARAFLVNTALSVVAIASTSLLGYLCLAEVRALRNELRLTNSNLNGIKGEDVLEGNAFDKIRMNNKACSKSNDTASTGEDVAEDSWAPGRRPSTSLLSSWFGTPEPDQWERDLQRVTRQLHSLQLKGSRPNGASYREVRFLLKELGLLEKDLQALILENEIPRKALLRRTDDLGTLTEQVGDGNRMLAVSDSSPTTSASSRGRGGAAATEIYASGSIELDDVASEGRGKQSQSRAPHQSERLRQQLLIEEQEDTLDQLSGTLGSLKQIGQDIDIEITYHNSLLVELNEAVDGTLRVE
eukprot:g4991.t1